MSGWKSVQSAASAVSKGKKGATARLYKAVKRYADASCKVKRVPNTKGRLAKAGIGKKRKKRRTKKRR